MSKPISRREFVGDASTLAMGAMIVPRHVLGGPGFRPPSATLNVAIVGAGGQGMSQWRALLNGGMNVVAIADVDFPYVERNINGQLNSNNAQSKATGLKVKDSYDKAKKYGDFREMIDKGARDFDAVVVATPDHTHAQVAVRAMKAGKHVYVQKPLTYSVYESRLLAKVAAETKVVTQMGNQGHSGDGTRRIVEIVASGVLGTITEAHIWTDRPVNYWAQGIPRPPIAPPTATPPAADAPPEQWAMRTVNRAVSNEMMKLAQSPPPGFNWELFLGCCAHQIPYHPVYHPFSWRGWVDFGVGALGDMGAHLIDQAYWALGLTYPTSIVASSSLWGTGTANGCGRQRGDEPGPEQPARDGTAGVVSTRDDGRVSFPRCGQSSGGEVVLVRRRPASAALRLHSRRRDRERRRWRRDDRRHKGRTHVSDLRRQTDGVSSFRRRGRGRGSSDCGAHHGRSHEMNWAHACMGEATISSPFEYGAMLNETMVLGVAALRADQGGGRKLLYDAPNMQFTNAPDANKYLTREYRKGWEL